MNYYRFSYFLTILLAVILLPINIFCAEVGDAEKGFAPVRPSVWTLSPGGTGSAHADFLELTGNNDASQWMSEAFPVIPKSIYQLRAKGCYVDGGGSDSAPLGFDFAHRDYYGLPAGEQPQSLPPFAAMVPTGINQTHLRASQWETMRTYRFADMEAIKVFPLYQGIKKRTEANQVAGSAAGLEGEYLLLGDGESITDGRYKFITFSNADSGNFDRLLQSFSCSFNSTRWCLGTGSEIVYQFELHPLFLNKENIKNNSLHSNGKKNYSFSEIEIEINIGYYVQGCCVLEFSSDGNDWKELGRGCRLGSFKANVDPNLLTDNGKTEEFYLRIRAEKVADSDSVNLQVYQLKVEAQTDATGYEGRGKTVFANNLSMETTDNANNVITETEQFPLFLRPNGSLVYCVKNNSNNLIDWNYSPAIFVDSQKATTLGHRKTTSLTGLSTIAPKEANCFATQLLDSPNADQAEWSFAFDPPISYILPVPRYLNQNYTRSIADIRGETADITLSWCEADYKVPRIPDSMKIQDAKPILIESPKNDFESFQVVLYCDEESVPITGITAVATDLVDKTGNRIDASNIELRYAWYHFVSIPTDSTSVITWWPDALVPLDKGSDGRGAAITLEPGCNLSIWTTVRIAGDTKAGRYYGSINVNDAGGRLSVFIPYELEVWDFTLAEKNHLETAYGLSHWEINRYHNCQTPEDRRAVFELYLKNFSDYRISPYDPAPYDSYRVNWITDSQEPQAELTIDQYTAELRRTFDKYHFTNFSLPIHGMGSGTYEARQEPSIGKFGESTPVYQALFSGLVKQLEEKLDKAGLLHAAYVYWFDEPEPKDYQFVANGFGRLARYAPRLQRMLTEEPSDEFCRILEENHAPLDIWCPVSYCFDSKEATKRREKNERFWWYVCTGPKAPYCTLFIDHPATELRVWHWQTWENKIVGNLVWTSNYWTSDTAFPDSPQNPYLDPMGYVVGAGLSPGSKVAWGNGDGRFLYPPLAAAVPGNNEGKPIIEPPVSSIRWEMIREGVQDYEMLKKLDDLVQANRENLTPQQRARIDSLFDFAPITTSLTQFTKDPQPILEKRRELARLIVELSK